MLHTLQSPPRANALALVDLVVEAALTDPVPLSRRRADRRFFKLYEELGEASQAYLAVTGSNTKKLTHVDLDIELADVFIVYLDLVLTWLRLGQESSEHAAAVDQLRNAMANHIDECRQAPHETAVGPRLATLFKVAADAHTELERPAGYAYTRLLQGMEALFLLLLQDSREPAQRATPEERMALMQDIVRRKIEKWKAMRTDND